MVVKVRFAPSPTGYLHVGNIRTALINWLFSRSGSGVFVLRIDDTDVERSKPEFETAIMQDMEWLGLYWAEFYRQSERGQLYESAKNSLLNQKRLYPCFETQEELLVKRKFQLSRGQPPIYDRAALKLTDGEIKAFEQQGRKPHYRFLLNDSGIIWDDLVRGDTSFSARNLSDPILFREDGVPTYTLSSVVDDGDLNITHVIRGEDHVTNTAVQIQLFEALFNRAPPIYAHLALLKTRDGELSKRVGGFSIRELKSSGILPIAIHSYLARLGTSDSVELQSSLEEIAQGLDFGHFGRAPANYDFDELKRINARAISGLSLEQATQALAAMGTEGSGITEDLWLAVRDNIESLAEVGEWRSICLDAISPCISDPDFLQQAGSLLPDGEWTLETWNKWTKLLKEKTGRKGKELFMPLRNALTGRESGPELARLLPIIGRERALKRLQGITA